ncbi:hypothetical protein [Ulvibacterium sp.]|uniref:Ig-like domain-containing protein n=1 Tax=Ulvibacterium sp. TaxID=2665914 RepID=UPI00260B9D2F|nr:hypothetical protein [Ulvibacterium sp.]
MKRFLLCIVGLILINCNSGDSSPTSDSINESPVENPVAEPNTAPSFADQTFLVLENTESGSVIGTLVASDPDGDDLQFLNPDIVGLEIDSATGELSFSPFSPIADYETYVEFEFDVTVNDGQTNRTARITLVIEDIDDGPLTNLEKAIVDSFLFQILFDDIEFPLFKRTEKAEIYLSGSVTPILENITQASVNEYNALFSDGFEIGIVADSLAANVQLYSSSVDDLADKWSDFHELALENPGLGGIAGGDRIWIADYAHNSPTLKHEMGHMIGLAHSPQSQCAFSGDNSIMCGGVGLAGRDFTELDRKLISYYYHPDMPNELPGNLVEERLTEIILSNR